jgi:transposase-like protein
MESRKRYEISFKTKIVLENLRKDKKVVDICRENKISPSLFYAWRKIFINVVMDSLAKNYMNASRNQKRSNSKQLINKQKKVIDKLVKLENFYQKILAVYSLNCHPKQLTIKQKQSVINIVENCSIKRSEALRRLGISRSSYYYWKKVITQQGSNSTKNIKKKKYEKKEYIDNVFSILHSPPRDYGFNRTTWRIEDIHNVMKSKNLLISQGNIMKIIKNEGYRFKYAKKVLTSTDPEYRKKLKNVTNILSKLKPTEKFFSIDEFGPFAIKMQGGRSLTPPGKVKLYPQFQKSKGCLILIGALELSTNQMTHLYTNKKDTEEMIKLLELLTFKYADQDSIYLSWDAASWHASKKLYSKVDEINNIQKKSFVKLSPLPACAQFLNVIESVFSGMARAIIHNSDYGSVQECKSAIDKYFKDRNIYFRKHPQRAGNKIWGKERIASKFCESNNCKDPKYLHNYSS